MALTDEGRVFRFDGRHWHAASRGLTGEGSPNSALACGSARFCLLVEQYGETYRWDGSRWHHSRGVASSYEAAMACASVHLCVLDTGTDLVEYRDGRWHHARRLTQSPDQPAISCAAGTACVATTWAGVLVRGRNGWSRPRGIEPSQGDLADVSCASAAWCMAVDAHGAAVRRDGSTWSAARQIDSTRDMTAVSCASRSFCVAVDGTTPYFVTDAPGKGHIVMYRNGRWRSPKLIDHDFGITDVSCASATRCVAVDAGGRALIWNGRRWSDPKPVGAALYAVACPSSSYCIAVGDKSAIRRDGTWRRIANPDGIHNLTDITCPTAGYCVAGGQRGFYIRHGGLWSTAVRRESGVDFAQVACVSAAMCFGSEDNQVDDWDYAFDGARAAFADDQLYGSKTSCRPNAVCVAVSLDTAYIGRPAARS
jgi:hypothetical protein